MAANLPLAETVFTSTPERPYPPKHELPTMHDLPSERVGEPGLPDNYHYVQANILTETCQTRTYPAEQVLYAIDLNLYYDPLHTGWYKRPDWYVVLGAPKADSEDGSRGSYVVWQEEVVPYLVVELLSPSTTNEDLGKTLRDVEQPPTKWQVYEQILRIPYYIVYERNQPTLHVFQHNGTRYQELVLDNNRWWSTQLQLGLGIWPGVHEQITTNWLRWYDTDGVWLPTRSEQIQQAEQRAEQLAAKLRALGVDPD